MYERKMKEMNGQVDKNINCSHKSVIQIMEKLESEQNLGPFFPKCTVCYFTCL